MPHSMHICLWHLTEQYFNHLTWCYLGENGMRDCKKKTELEKSIFSDVKGPRKLDHHFK